MLFLFLSLQSLLVIPPFDSLHILVPIIPAYYVFSHWYCFKSFNSFLPASCSASCTVHMLSRVTFQLGESYEGMTLFCDPWISLSVLENTNQMSLGLIPLLSQALLLLSLPHLPHYPLINNRKLLLH